MENAPEVVVGIDWAHEEHQVCVLDEDGSVLENRPVKHERTAIHDLADRLLRLADGDPRRVCIGIEVPRGPLVETLIERRFRVFAINPKQMDRFRDRFFPSGAKDDRRDAEVIASSLRTDRRAYRELDLDDPVVIEIREVSRMMEDLREEENRLGNRLRDLLRRAYPQALDADPSGTAPWLLSLLETAPSPELGARLTRSRIGAILKRHRIRKTTPVEVRRKLQEASLTLAPGTTTACARHVRAIVPRLRLVQEQRRDLKKELKRLLAAFDEAETSSPEENEHRDVEILLSWPGVGEIVAATMLAEASRPLRARDYQAVRALAGIAPVTVSSGKRSRRRASVSMRQACNGRLRNAVYHWARVATQHEPRARYHYSQLRSRGHSHGRALRGVADRLLAAAMACLRSGELYASERRALSAAA